MFKFIIIPDPEYNTITQDNIYFAVNEVQMEGQVLNLAKSGKVLEGSICVYELAALHKMIEKPKFAKYTVNKNGEILPD